jgi:hypothetical protein
LRHWALGEGRLRLQSPRNMTLTLREHRWARTVSNRRPLMCKAEPERPRRRARRHSILEFPAQGLVASHSVHGLSDCVCLSWHTLGTTGLPLDRGQPLWEMWVIEGGARDGALAVMLKVHHAVVDGVAGRNLLAQLCGLEPDAPPPQPVRGAGSGSRCRSPRAD